MTKLFHLAVYIFFTYVYLRLRSRIRDSECFIDTLQIKIDDLKKEVRNLKNKSP